MTQTTIRFKKGERPFLSKEPLALCDIASLVTETGQNRRSTYVSTENMVKDYQGVVFDNSEDPVNGIVYKPGDVLVSNIRPYLKKVWLADRCGVCSSDVLCIRPNNGVKSNYLFSLLARDSFITNMMRAAKGSKMPRGDKEFTMSFPVDYCTEEDEQEMIGTFFTELDNLIAASADEVAALEEAKKGMMQKFFSREMRFKRDDGTEYPDWENHKLKDVCVDFIVPMRDKPKEFDGSIPWCRIEDIEGKYFTTSRSGQFVSKETIKKMNLKLHPAGTVICSCSASLGTYAIATQPLITNQTFIGLVCSDSIYNEYLLYYMMTQTAQLKRLAGGTTILYISREKFEEHNIAVPCLEEQHCIADLLSSMDDAIVAAKDELAGYRELKHGLLQKMFA